MKLFQNLRLHNTLRMVLSCSLVMVLLPLTMQAGPIDQNEALQKAKAFLKERGIATGKPTYAPMSAKSRRAKARPDVESDYYVFNIGDGDGFVIVSGDDRTADILGYADHGSISDDAMPDGLRYMLDEYAKQIAWLEEHAADSKGTRKAVSRRASARTPIAPLIQTHWDQGAPYNNNCPSITYTNKKNQEVTENAVTGCVATSMAQLMYYHQCPQETYAAIPGYTTEKRGITLSALPATTFNWSAMTTTYKSSDEGAAADAVAKLMQYCGWALQMDYNVSANGGSSAYNASIPEALTTFFGYDGSTTYVQRNHYSYEQWVSLIYSELAVGRPVILGGQSAGGGHSFVCDGYDVDDYFYINWGWGGSSDGFFRLSVLQPWEQGIGGSSTLDGFNFNQDAVIGIRPYTDTSAGARLALEELQFPSDDTNTQTITRASADAAFTGISIKYVVYNYLFHTNTFDYAIQFTDAEGRVLATFSDNNGRTINFNYGEVNTPVISTPVALADGTYYFKVVSRATGDTSWHNCYDGEQLKLTAIVSGNTMTITAPIVSSGSTLPTAATITVPNNGHGYLTKGYEQEVIASITGGTLDYHGNVILRVNNTAVMGKSLDIPAGQTIDAHFAYTPTTTGDKTLTLYTAGTGGSKIGNETNITIAESDATDDLDLTFSATIDNLTSSTEIYGNALRATITVENASTTNSYAGKLLFRVYKMTSEDNIHWSGSSIGYTTYPLTVEKNGSTIIKVAHDGLETGARYSAKIFYLRTTSGQTSYTDGPQLGLYTATTGYSIGDANGNLTVYPLSEGTINAGDACLVNLHNFDSFDGITITPSSNPNCLYFLEEGVTVPSSLSGHNVVTGTAASTITLEDGHDFYSPIAFTAENISYTRTFNVAANGSSGWNTIVLPFAPTTITCNGVGPVDWFHSANDEDKNFWLRAFSSDGSGTVVFDYTDQMKANEPYIIAVPDDRFGDEWEMTGKPVTFSATNVTIAATKKANVSGNSFKLCGATTAKTLKDVYLLNAKGSKFVKATTNTSVDAFRAWFEPVSITSLTLPSLAIGAPETTGIKVIGSDNIGTQETGWYTLNGQKLSGKPTAPGIYIMNGKKIFIR